jgi:hypothetical protein
MTQKKVRILLAEDDSAETVDILASLFPGSTGGLDLTVVSTMATLIPTVKMVDPELILLDLELSLSNPLDAVHLVHRAAPGIPLWFWPIQQRSSTRRRASAKARWTMC